MHFIVYSYLSLEDNANIRTYFLGIIKVITLIFSLKSRRRLTELWNATITNAYYNNRMSTYDFNIIIEIPTSGLVFILFFNHIDLNFSVILSEIILDYPDNP